MISRPWMTLAGRSGGGKVQSHRACQRPLQCAGGARERLDARASARWRLVGAGQVTYALAGIGNDRRHGRIDAGFDTIHTNVDLKSVYFGVDLIRLHPTDARIWSIPGMHNRAIRKLAGEIHLEPNVIDVSLTKLALQMSRRHLAASASRDDAQDCAANRDAESALDQRAEGNLAARDRRRSAARKMSSLIVNGFDLATSIRLSRAIPGSRARFRHRCESPALRQRRWSHAQMQIKPLGRADTRCREIDANAQLHHRQMVADAEIYQDATHQLIANATIPMQLGWDKSFIAYASGGHQRPGTFERHQFGILELDQSAHRTASAMATSRWTSR